MEQNAIPGTSTGTSATQQEVVTRREGRIKVRRREMRLLMKIIVNIVRRRRLQRQAQERRQRRYWVNPINSLRSEGEHIGQLYSELRQCPEKFLSFCGMPIEAFDRLVTILGGHLRREDTIMRRAINPTERLLITLRYLATGESYASLHLQFRVGKSTISGIVKSTCHVIWQYLQPIAMPSVTQETWLKAAAGFHAVTSFPNCIGAIDSKRVRVQQPPQSRSQYFNCKGHFSIVLMAVADATYRFLAIKVGAYGNPAESRTLLTSVFGQGVLVEQVTLPPPRPLPGTTHPVPFVIVSDEAFPLMTNMLHPYPQRKLNTRKRVFNIRLSRAQQFVKSTFGIMANKWRILTCALQLDADTVDVVIKSACVLHNYVRDYDHSDMEVEPQIAFGEPPVSCAYGRASSSAMEVRDAFAKYFMSPVGAVPWQFNSLGKEQPDQD
ncbi:uncharacterized protein [Engystomops pustulosus]|uniref:uncharacterized protein n=1 Tax=Engystomops pustulosus TaxID=76066 RepID=UPI003AFB0DCA